MNIKMKDYLKHAIIHELQFNHFSKPAYPLKRLGMQNNNAM